jgi:hypothetical protein
MYVPNVKKSPKKATQYIKEDINEYKAVTLSKYIGNLLCDSVSYAQW